jgi:hypothetical protein
MRRDGTTTRLVDKGVQILFETGCVVVPLNLQEINEITELGHRRGETLAREQYLMEDYDSYNYQVHLLETLARRLDVEHPGAFYRENKTTFKLY